MTHLTNKDIAHESGEFWVLDGKTHYSVMIPKTTHSESESSYQHTADGLNLAISRCNYLAKKAGDRAKQAHIPDLEEVSRFANYYSTEQLKAARAYAAKIHGELADSAFDEEAGFASHVTNEDRQKYADAQRRYADEVEAGKHDNNFTIWQRMHYFLTGELVPFLPE